MDHYYGNMPWDDDSMPDENAEISSPMVLGIGFVIFLVIVGVWYQVLR
jgi:hypothetical protein